MFNMGLVAPISPGFLKGFRPCKETYAASINLSIWYLLLLLRYVYNLSRSPWLLEAVASTAVLKRRESTEEIQTPHRW